MQKLLSELNRAFPERAVVLARELTKKFEEFLRGKPSELLALTQNRTLKGEFVVMLAPPPQRRKVPEPEIPTDPATPAEP